MDNQHNKEAMGQMETRAAANKLQITGNKLVGYAAVWDKPYTVNERGKTFTEIMRRGAFKKAIDTKADIVVSANHTAAPQSQAMPIMLGRTSSGTATIEEDDIGLRYEVTLPETRADIKELVQRGDLHGSSVAMIIPKGGDSWNNNTREIRSAFLLELGPVVDPVNPATSVALRSALPSWKMQLQILEAE